MPAVLEARAGAGPGIPVIGEGSIGAALAERSEPPALIEASRLSRSDLAAEARTALTPMIAAAGGLTPNLAIEIEPAKVAARRA
jgi:hypothetical protein